MENDDKTPDNRAMYLKPTRFDLVLDGVTVLLLLVFWVIALRPFVFPDFYPDRSDQFGEIFMAIVATLIGMIYFRHLRFPTPVRSNLFVKITEENIERQYRLNTRLMRFISICSLLIFLRIPIGKLLPMAIDIIFFAIYVVFFACLFFWYIIRARMLK